jgi:c-di-GMP-binding flagellar brake protein YcgR
MQERRRAARWQINKEAGLTFEGGISPIPCTVEDISTSGMKVSLNRNLFHEAFSNFRLALAEDLVFDVGAHVAWHDNAYENNIYGLSFNRIEESAISWINEYVKNNFSGGSVEQWWRGA